MLVMASAGKLAQAGKAALLITAQPFANGRHGGGEALGGRLDTSLPGALSQSQAMVVAVFHLTQQIEIACRHGHAL